MNPLFFFLIPILGLFCGPWEAAAAQPPGREASAEEFRVLVFSHTTGFRHGSIPAGIAAVEKMGRELGFAVDRTEAPEKFSAENLSRYEVIVFMNTNGTLFDENQREALQSYIRAGGGFVGVHSASATEYEWDWYRRLVGAHFDKHPRIQPAVVRVEDGEHCSTRHLPEVWERTDEWYNFRSNPREDVRVLLSLDTDSFKGSTMPEDHPIAWCHEFNGGRSWYTGLGHTDESYTEPAFLKHLSEGIFWAAGRRE